MKESRATLFIPTTKRNMRILAFQFLKVVVLVKLQAHRIYQLMSQGDGRNDSTPQNLKL